VCFFCDLCVVFLLLFLIPRVEGSECQVTQRISQLFVFFLSFWFVFFEWEEAKR
jgi:hypothetical protein